MPARKCQPVKVAIGQQKTAATYLVADASSFPRRGEPTSSLPHRLRLGEQPVAKVCNRTSLLPSTILELPTTEYAPEFLGDTNESNPDEAALRAVPVFYAGGEWDAEAQLYVMGGRFYDPYAGRWVTDGGGENGYKFADNNPTRERVIEETTPVEDYAFIRGLVGDDNLARASDTALFLGTTSVVAGAVFGGYGALAAFGLVSGAATATAAASTSTIGASLSATGSVLTYASLGVSGAQVAFTGQGTGNLLADSVSLGIDAVATATSGRLRATLLAIDAGINLFQGGYSTVQSYEDFRQGDYLGGTFNAIGATLGLGSAGIRGAQLNQLRSGPRGNWVEAIRNDGDSLTLQSLFSGKEIQYRGGKASIEEYKLDDAYFDRFQDNVLGEVKGNFDFAARVGASTPKAIRFVEALQSEALRQVGVARKYGLPLEWHVRRQDENAFRNVLRSFDEITIVPYDPTF